jgi:hypothetical protein
VVGGGPILPPEGTPPDKLIIWKPAWSPDTGWIIVGTPNPDNPDAVHPAPST